MPEAPVKARVIVCGAVIGAPARSTGGCRSIELAVALQYLVPWRERLRQPLDEVDRAVASAGAADRHGEVVAIVARVVGQPAGDEVVDVAVHSLDFGHGLQ